jgi:DNA-binding NarL/FixJ family response regulator
MTTKPSIRVLLADDHPLFRKGIASLLSAEADFEVVGEASNGQEAIEKALDVMPDVILMDISMPGVNGLEATQRIKQELPYVHIIILTVSDEDQNLFEAIKNGAQGYLLKKIDPPTLFRTLRGALEGEAPLSRVMATKLLTEFARQRRAASEPRAPSATLTEREKEVLGLLAAGKTNKDIAGALGIAENTVKNHLKNILEKLHLENRVQAATFALREGLLNKPPKKNG